MTARSHIRIALAVISLLIGSSAMGMPIPPEVKHIVTFVYVPDSSGGEPRPNGTAFFVAVPSERDPEKGSVYLVTAKHVLIANNTKQIRDHVYLRLNKKDGGVEFGRINLVETGPAKNVFTHDDPTVDLAVVTVLPDPNKYELKWLPEQLILSRESFKSQQLIEGTEVFFTGLFTPHIGKERNYPVARFGRVALVTEEKVFWNGKDTELFLMKRVPTVAIAVHRSSSTSARSVSQECSLSENPS